MTLSVAAVYLLSDRSTATMNTCQLMGFPYHGAASCTVPVQQRWLRSYRLAVSQ